MARIFTIGYEGRTLQEFIDLLDDAGVNVLIDVRETAWSHKPGFSKTALSHALSDRGIEYLHARFAGNPKTIRTASRSHEDCLRRYARHLESHPRILDELTELIDAHVAARRAVALTCFERHPDDCHRGELARRLAQTARRVVKHLSPDGGRRLTTA